MTMNARSTDPLPSRQTRTALEALNLFMADMQAGIGPFLGVFLQQRGWKTGAIGLDDDSPDKAEGWKVFFESKPLLVLAASLALFHLGNGAMLPLYGMAVVAAHRGDPTIFVAATVVVAQAVMTAQGLGASLSPAIGGAIAQAFGYPIAFLTLGCFALGSLALWLAFAGTLKAACAVHPDLDDAPSASSTTAMAHDI
jgi:hypothetical protein